jgi:hypothetical protein
VESDDDSPDQDPSDDEIPQSKKVSLYALLLDSVQLFSIITKCRHSCSNALVRTENGFSGERT